MDALQALVRGLRGVEQFAVRSIGHIHESDVVVLAVEAAGGGLVDPFEPVGAHDGRVGQRVLHIETIGDAALFLATGLFQPRSHAAPRRAEVEFADQDGAIDQAAHLVDFRLVHPVGVVWNSAVAVPVTYAAPAASAATASGRAVIGVLYRTEPSGASLAMKPALVPNTPSPATYMLPAGSSPKPVTV